jgi:hypothetical protein
MQTDNNGTTPSNTTPTTEPASAQPNPQKVETEQGTKKLRYSHIELCKNCGQHGKVYFMDKEGSESLYTFEDITRISKLMDEGTALIFQLDVGKFQSQDKLQFLLPDDQARAMKQEPSAQFQKKLDLAIKLKNIGDQLFALDDEFAKLKTREQKLLDESEKLLQETADIIFGRRP